MTTPDNSLVSRLTALQEQHQWMEPDAQMALAASATSDDELHGIADALKQRVAQTWDGISHFFDDPVLQKDESKTLAIKRYVQGSIGITPVSDSSLTHIQARLQAQGFGTDLPVTGAWDPAWQAALQQHARAEYDKQLAGDKAGSVSSGGFLHSLLGSLTPSGAASGLLGFAKTIPSDIGSLASDAWGSLSGIPESVLNPGKFNSKAGQDEINKRIVDTQNTLGVNKYRQKVGLPQTTYENYDPIASAVNDLGTLFLISGAGTGTKIVAGEAKKASAEGLLSLSKEEAIRKQRAIAKTLLSRPGTRFVGGATVGGTVGGIHAAATGKDIGTGIGAGIVLGGLTGGLMPRRAFDNLPVLKNTGPTLAKLLDNDGIYYTARTRLAAPYQVSSVRLAGTALAQAQAFSLKAHAVGYLEHLFGGDAGDIQQGIERSAPLNGINDALRNRLSFTAGGASFAPDLDYLMYFLHGPMTVGAAGTAAKAIADSGKASTDGFNAALQHVGAIGQVEQGTGKSYKELLTLAGGDPDRLHLWIGNKVQQHAAMQHAEEVMSNLRAVAPDKYNLLHPDERYELLRQESAAVWRDPEAMKTAVGRMLGSGENYLARNIQNEIARSAASPTAHLKHELSDYLDAGDILSHRILPSAEKYLLTPQSVPNYKGLPIDIETGKPQQGLTYLGAGKSAPGSLGLARLHADVDGVEDVSRSTLTSQQATRDLQGFERELAEATTPEAQVAFTEKAADYLFHNYGLDARALSVFATTPERIITILGDRAKTLAAEVHLSADAPAELRQAFKDLNAKGYRVVSGTDIGHTFRTDLPPLADLGAPISSARKVVSTLGLNPQRFSRLDYGADRRLHVTLALQKAVDDGRIQLPPYYTVQTLLHDLQDDEIVGKQLPWVANVLFAASRRAHQGSIDELVRGGAENAQAAEAMLKANMAAASGLRQLSRKDVERVLTRTDRVPWASAVKDDKGFIDEANQIPLMSPEHATEVFRAIQKGYAETPAYMLGLQKVEDMARYLPFRVGDALQKHVPGGKALNTSRATLALMNLPNRLAQIRDTYRFNLSPYFSLRRIAKTNIKMGIDGVAPTITPVRTLREQGVYDDAHKTLDRILGTDDPRYKYLDEMDRYLDSKDVFGLYNPRHFEAYYAHAKAKEGWTDEQIHEGIVRVFQYGSRGQEGRTAMERSVNTVFFPFSFEKTVVRNVGGYLLDKPAQALILSNALDAYRDFNNHHLDGNNPLAMSWYEQHVPLLKEVLRLNAFAHGISPGEFGGVNRPLLNAFLPQSWASSPDSSKTLMRFVPAVADLHRIISEGTEQSRIIRQSLINGVSIIEGHPDYALNARPSNKTELAQRAEATRWRNDLVGSFKAVLDYNESVDTDEDKYHFGLGPNIPDALHGAVINRSAIGQIVHQQYPVYDPYSGAAYAIQKQAEAQAWLNERRGTADYGKYADFYDKAKTVVSHLNDEAYPVEQAAQIQGIFHQVAVDYASKDPAFYRWYNASFARSLGPLEKV